MTDGSDVISWASLEGLEKAMGKDAAAAFAKRLLGFLDEKVAEMDAAFASGDHDKIRHCLHKTASNAAALGALQLSGLARELEQGCADGRWNDVKSRHQAVIALARQSLAALKTRLG